MNLEFLKSIIDHVAETDALYKTNFVDGSVTHPIPYFGNIESAEILTVGVNPASSEFDKQRQWPDRMSVEELEIRLKNYFNLGIPSPHNWFKPWERALNALDHSYFRGDAAHLDLSPRATTTMRNAPDQSLFIDMIQADMGLFFGLLTYCRRAKLLMIAGTVSKNYYIDKFIQMHSRKYGFCFEGDTQIRSGDAKIACHRLVGDNFNLPVFFCSVSPSAPGSGPDRLIQRVKENKMRLLSLIDENI